MLLRYFFFFGFGALQLPALEVIGWVPNPSTTTILKSRVPLQLMLTKRFLGFAFFFFAAEADLPLPSAWP